MKKLKMHSPDLAGDNIARIRDLFPGCVSETRDENGELRLAIDFDQLRQELSDEIVEGPQERYRLDWPGKREAMLAANAPIAKTLRPCREESVDFDTTKNLFIEGDNLDALKLLQETYLGKVKMIYIDPPYNTGNDFIYKDNFAESTEDYLLDSGQKDEVGNRLVANTSSNGRFHSDWLSFIYPRLKLARSFLKQDGAIFVSCDENEHTRLRAMMDEIYGQGNFVADMVWAAGRKNDSRLVSVSHEYIVCYAKDTQYLKESKIQWRQTKKGLDDIYRQYQKLKKEYGDDYTDMSSGLQEWFKNLADGNPAKAHKHYSHVDFRGIYFPDNISWPGGGGPKYEVLHPVTNKPCKTPSGGWRFEYQKMQELIRDDRIHFGDDDRKVPCTKSYLKNREQEVLYSVFYRDGRAATKRLCALLDGNVFDHPKDEFVLADLIEACTNEKDIILDFFAGSATTTHAVMQLNAEDGGNRKFIMVQLPEPCDEKTEAFKAGYTNIAEISKERIRRAGKKILGGGGGDCHPDWNKDIGFRVLKIDTSNMADVYYTPQETRQTDLWAAVDTIKPGRDNPEDLLFQVLVDWGVDLTLPIRRQTIQGKAIFFVNHEPYDLIACFDEGITEELVRELAAYKPLRVVFRDNGFASDAVKINVDQIFRQLSSSTTEVKAI